MSIPLHEVERVTFATRCGPVNEFVRRVREVLPRLAGDIDVVQREVERWDERAYELSAAEPGTEEHRAYLFASRMRVRSIHELVMYAQHAAYVLAETDPERYREIAAINARNDDWPGCS
jgi:hypothetical protein